MMRFVLPRPVRRTPAGHAWLRLVGSCLFTLVLAATAGFAHAKRVALVIGNAAYKVGPLANPVNDARAFDAKLRELGFASENIVMRENLRRNDIGRVIREFVGRIAEGDEVVIFYAGHGIQFKGVNYLPAVDADIESEEDVPLNAINVGQLLERVEEAKPAIKLIFLDACRNNPFARSFRSADRGLARMGEAPSGTLISFATRPGSVAADGTGQHGTYTFHLLKHIGEPGVPIELLLKRVAAAVENETRGKQEPWIEGSIRGDFYFRAAAPAPAPVALPSTEDRERQLWATIQAAQTAEPFEEYLRQYPNGLFKADARVLIARFQAVQQRRTEDDAETRAWAAAERAGGEAGYEAYLAAHPAGKFANLAKTRLGELLKARDLQSWIKARSGSVADVQGYLHAFPGGAYAAEATERLRRLNEEAAINEEVGVWSQATTRAGLNLYLVKYPQGRFVEEARKRLSTLDARDLEERNRPAPAGLPARPQSVVPPAM